MLNLKKSDQDLFHETSMSFGEHLDELRICLWRAIVGLTIGFIIGLLFGNRVVQLIQTPMENALETYYIEQGLKELEDKIEELEADGYPEDFLEQVEEKRRIPDLVYLYPHELRDILGIPEPDETAIAPEATQDPPEEGNDPNPDASDSEESIDPNSDSEESPDLDDPVTNVDEVTDEEEETVSEDEAEAEDAEETDEEDMLVEVYLWRDIETDAKARMKSLNAHEAFMIWIKASFVVGFMISSPWVFFQIWSFVAAGLYRHERRYIYVFMPISLTLFFSGAALAFFVVLRYVLNFLFIFNRNLGIDPDPRISEWMSFVLMLPLGFGIAFQLPLVMLFLERIGIFSVQSYLRQWRVAILVICVISMFLTPSDPQSMLLMAGPLVMLYFVGILMCRFMPRYKSPYDADGRAP
jgi:sec-independent protein translocase protein TatC